MVNKVCEHVISGTYLSKKGTWKTEKLDTLKEALVAGCRISFIDKSKFSKELISELIATINEGADRAWGDYSIKIDVTGIYPAKKNGQPRILNARVPVKATKDVAVVQNTTKAQNKAAKQPLPDNLLGIVGSYICGEGNYREIEKIFALQKLYGFSLRGEYLKECFQGKECSFNTAGGALLFGRMKNQFKKSIFVF